MNNSWVKEGMYCTIIVTSDDPSQPGAWQAVFFLISVVSVGSMLPNYQYLFLSCNLYLYPVHSRQLQNLTFHKLVNIWKQQLSIDAYSFFSYECSSKVSQKSLFIIFTNCNSRKLPLAVLITLVHVLISLSAW